MALHTVLSLAFAWLSGANAACALLYWRDGRPFPWLNVAMAVWSLVMAVLP